MAATISALYASTIDGQNTMHIDHWNKFARHAAHINVDPILPHERLWVFL